MEKFKNEIKKLQTEFIIIYGEKGNDYESVPENTTAFIRISDNLNNETNEVVKINAEELSNEIEQSKSWINKAMRSIIMDSESHVDTVRNYLDSHDRSNNKTPEYQFLKTLYKNCPQQNTDSNLNPGIIRALREEYRWIADKSSDILNKLDSNSLGDCYDQYNKLVHCENRLNFILNKDLGNKIFEIEKSIKEAQTFIYSKWNEYKDDDNIKNLVKEQLPYENQSFKRQKAFRALEEGSDFKDYKNLCAKYCELAGKIVEHEMYIILDPFKKKLADKQKELQSTLADLKKFTDQEETSNLEGTNYTETDNLSQSLSDNIAGPSSKTLFEKDNSNASDSVAEETTRDSDEATKVMSPVADSGQSPEEKPNPSDNLSQSLSEKVGPTDSTEVANKKAQQELRKTIKKHQRQIGEAWSKLRTQNTEETFVAFQKTLRSCSDDIQGHSSYETSYRAALKNFEAAVEKFRQLLQENNPDEVKQKTVTQELKDTFTNLEKALKDNFRNEMSPFQTASQSLSDNTAGPSSEKKITWASDELTKKISPVVDFDQSPEQELKTSQTDSKGKGKQKQSPSSENTGKTSQMLEAQHGIEKQTKDYSETSSLEITEEPLPTNEPTNIESNIDWSDEQSFLPTNENSRSSLLIETSQRQKDNHQQKRKRKTLLERLPKREDQRLSWEKYPDPEKQYSHMTGRWNRIEKKSQKAMQLEDPFLSLQDQMEFLKSYAHLKQNQKGIIQIKDENNGFNLSENNEAMKTFKNAIEGFHESADHFERLLDNYIPTASKKAQQRAKIIKSNIEKCKPLFEIVEKQKNAIIYHSADGKVNAFNEACKNASFKYDIAKTNPKGFLNEIKESMVWITKTTRDIIMHGENYVPLVKERLEKHKSLMNRAEYQDTEEYRVLRDFYQKPSDLDTDTGIIQALHKKCEQIAKDYDTTLKELQWKEDSYYIRYGHLRRSENQLQWLLNGNLGDTISDTEKKIERAQFFIFSEWRKNKKNISDLVNKEKLEELFRENRPYKRQKAFRSLEGGSAFNDYKNLCTKYRELARQLAARKVKLIEDEMEHIRTELAEKLADKQTKRWHFLNNVTKFTDQEEADGQNESLP